MNNIILREKRNGDSRFNEVVLNIDKNQQCKRGCIDSDPRKIMVGDIIKSDDQNFDNAGNGNTVYPCHWC